MTTHHIASWLLRQSDVPLTVLKPLAVRLGVSTNHLGAALFAGQLVYENQGAIVEYADRGGVRVGRFLHGRAVERYGEDHPLSEYLGENVAALDEAFDGSEEEAVTFAEFYRRLRAVDRDAPDRSVSELLAAATNRAVEDRVPDPRDSAPDPTDAMRNAKTAAGAGARTAVGGAKGAVTSAKGAVSDATERVGDATDAVGDTGERPADQRSDSETEGIEIPVTDGK